MWYFASLILELLIRLFILICSNISLVLMAYLISTRILKTGDHGITWLILITVFTIALYMAVFFAKGFLIGLKAHGNITWIPIFFICVGCTSVIPVWIFFGDIMSLVKMLGVESNRTVTWIFAVFTGGYFYSRYHFLTNAAPAYVFPFYEKGLACAALLTHAAARIRAVKSSRIY